MKPADPIKRLFKKAHVDTHPQPDETVFATIRSAYFHGSSTTSVLQGRRLWRFIMKSPMTKLAMLIVMGVAVGIVFNQPKAYALAETIKANNGIRWLRIVHSLTWTNPERVIELHLGYDEQGEIAQFRININTAGPPVGPALMTYRANREDVWLPQHNVRLIGDRDPRYILGALGIDASELDPVHLFKKLSEQEKQGQALVQISQPDDKQSPIIVIVTYPTGSRSEDWKKVFTIDQDTHWVSKIEKYVRHEEGFQHRATTEFFDYNQKIDQAMFTLEEEADPDTEVMELSDVPTGLLQGDMTDEEVVTEVVRQFFEAILAQDYQCVSQLFMSLPDFLTKQFLALFSQAKFDRILSVGPTYPDPDPDSNLMISSCKVLANILGKDYEITCDLFVVRCNEAPARWTICGTSWNTKPVSD